MNLILISFFVFMLIVVLMSVGVLFSDKAIKGSCGGLASLFGKGSCEICEKKDQCEKIKV